MSGGHFDYKQYNIEDISTGIKELIESNDSKDKNSYGEDVGLHYPPEIIKKFDQAKKFLLVAEAMAQRVDWLVSGDDGEDSFHIRWEKEVTPLLKDLGV